MNKLNLKMLIAAATISFGGQLFAFNQTGISKDFNNDVFPPSTIRTVSDSSEWCIARVVDEKINCNFKSNSGLFNDTHKVICSLGVSLAPVITSDEDELALDREVMGYKVWAFHAEIPGGNALALAFNLPFYALKTQVDGLINIATYNTLETIKSGVDQIANGPAMVDAIQSVLKERSCAQYKNYFTNTFTKKKIKKEKVLSADPCEKVSVESGYEHCGFKRVEETFTMAKFQVNKENGQIYQSQPIDESSIQKNTIVKSFCHPSYDYHISKSQCSREYNGYKYELDNQLSEESGSTNQAKTSKSKK